MEELDSVQKFIEGFIFNQVAAPDDFHMFTQSIKLF